MAEKWNDLFVRTDLSETSPEGRKGGLGSPDIIPAGTKPVSPGQYTTDTSYGQYYNNSLYQNLPNYIYVRAKNSSQTLSKSGKARLVLTDPAIILWPGGDGWTRIKNSKGSYESPLTSAGSPDIGPNKIGVTEDPFLYTPSDFGHRCLVTWLDTTDHPDPGPPPKITKMDDLVRFLKEHENYAHHNIDIVADTSGRHTKSKSYTQGPESKTIRFTLTTVNCKGFVIGYNCATPIAPDKYIIFEDTEVNTNDKTGYHKDFEIPANFQADIVYFFDQKNLRPETFSVTLGAHVVSQPGDAIYELCFPPEHFGFTKASPNDESRFYPVGSVTAMRGTVSA